MRNWCDHIIFHIIPEQFIINDRNRCHPYAGREGFAHNDVGMAVRWIPDDWQVCPICKEPRPIEFETKKEFLDRKAKEYDKNHNKETK